jgi:biopolymer transport protein ExbD
MYGWDDNPDLNITPFVDVMLVLMAILMVTAPTITYQEQITLPQGTKSKKVDKRATLTIRMDRDGVIYLDRDRYTLKNFANNFILSASKYDADSDVYIRADESLPYRDVMYLLRLLKKTGFSRVSLLTE